jgi:hypothetical protein
VTPQVPREVVLVIDVINAALQKCPTALAYPAIRRWRWQHHFKRLDLN